MLLYEMLLGRPAYPGTPDEALRAIAQGPPAPLRALAPSLPPLLFDVVESALAYDPTRRFASASAFRNALLRASQPRPVKKTTFVDFAIGAMDTDEDDLFPTTEPKPPGRVSGIRAPGSVPGVDRPSSSGGAPV